jgi:predicted acyl esterase
MRFALLNTILLATLTLAGCTSSNDGGDSSEGEPFDASLPMASYLHDLSPADPEYAYGDMIIEQYRTIITESLELDTWIARPNTQEPVPIVLEVTPYYTGGAPASLGRDGDELLSRGYAVGISSVRGTGNSGGCFTQGGTSEAKDTAEVIKHMAGQSWSNGNVGLMGVSYPGTTPQDVWVENPEGLKTIIPISGISDLYKYNFVNGVPILVQGYAFNLYYWALEGPTTFDPTDTPTVPGAIAGELCAEQADVQEGGATSTVDGNKDAYWQERDFGAELLAAGDAERASVFYIHGLQDWNVKPHMMEGWLDQIWESGSDVKVLLGQWPHAWPSSSSTDFVCPEAGACREDWWNQTMVAWFDYYLKGIDTGILDAPLVQVQDDDMKWRHEAHFPANDALIRLPLGPTLGTEGTASQTYFDGLGGLTPLATMATQAEWVSEPLTEDYHLSGMPVFHGNVTADSARASLMLTLQEEREDGSRRSINFGIQSLNHVASLASGNPTIRDLRQEVNLNLFPQEDVIHAGSRIVLIASGNTIGSPGPGMQPQSTGASITIEEAGAWLELPLDQTVVYEAITWAEAP